MLVAGSNHRAGTVQRSTVIARKPCSWGKTDSRRRRQESEKRKLGCSILDSVESKDRAGQLKPPPSGPGRTKREVRYRGPEESSKGRFLRALALACWVGRGPPHRPTRKLV